MELIRFTIPGAPATITAQQKGVRVRAGRAHHFTKDAVKAEANRLYVGAYPHRPKKPISGVPLVVTYLVVYPMTKEQIAASIEQLGDDALLLFKLSTPDWDNSVKLLQDVLSAPRGTRVRSSIPKLSFWSDDSIIADAHVFKRAGCVPRIEVTISGANLDPHMGPRMVPGLLG